MYREEFDLVKKGKTEKNNYVVAQQCKKIICLFFFRLVIFAGDVTPVDIMCHMPAVCEEKNIPYIYTPSRLELGHSLGLKRTSLMVLIKEHPDYQSSFDELAAELKTIPPQC